LTGSCIRTFGYACAGLFSNNDTLAQRIAAAGDETGERAWRLPIWDVYAEDMQSDIADIRNLGDKPMAGATTAAKFLEAFIDNHPCWAHLDIAGVAFGAMDYGAQKCATGYGIRLLVRLIEGYAPDSSS
jgi:leucyl aminopeptidase